MKKWQVIKTVTVLTVIATDYSDGELTPFVFPDAQTVRCGRRISPLAAEMVLGQEKRIRSEDEKKYLFVTPAGPTKGCCLIFLTTCQGSVLSS